MTLFGPDNLPYGVFSEPGHERRIGVRLDDVVLDVSELLPWPSLNPFLALGRPEWTRIRGEIRSELRRWRQIALGAVELHMPFEVADYTDFYSSEHHAVNVSRILRPGEPGLPPQWKHLPIGYHGRAGTVVVSGTPVRRPYGQLGPGLFGPAQRLDIEAEVGFVVGTPGARIPTTAWRDHVFGVVLVNDWSARDIQAFEYRPLGPFLAKSFATSISPWVTPLEAFADGKPPEQDPQPLPYLLPPGSGLDVTLRVEWNGTEVSRPSYNHMYWTAAQQLAHLTVNGAAVRTGDLFASGTVSGPTQTGSFLELTENGTRPVRLGNGDERGFLEDGDQVTISATAAGAEGGTIGLGPVSGTVCP
ncbi:fumarylacetoacetate hydrolase family protein [Symbioplanes lichenis]|uniref:fumarylacetoacetate hydrolase family protein n=1 Tax=Symbioplanes lichenis TaxID=1629072 RepID=UPI00273A0226|nr:fumarylacetoacetate hydrolase family protein [Actinoplanes lichenis]